METGSVQNNLGSPNHKGDSPDNPARIYIDGIFDLFHFGHARALEQAKTLKPYVYLIVGVCSDELTHSKKGQTVMYEHERYESLRHCRWVDEVVSDAPWVIDRGFLDKHRIDFVAQNEAPYAGEGCLDVYEFVKSQGRFLAIKRTTEISTSDLITRIVRDYDIYVRRNLERGVSPQDLNISFLKKRQIQVKKQVIELTGKLTKGIRKSRGSIIRNWTGSKSELMSLLHMWECKSQELIKDFSHRFDFGTMGNIFRRKDEMLNPNIYVDK